MFEITVRSKPIMPPDTAAFLGVARRDDAVCVHRALSQWKLFGFVVIMSATLKNTIAVADTTAPFG